MHEEAAPQTGVVVSGKRQVADVNRESPAITQSPFFCVLRVAKLTPLLHPLHPFRTELAVLPVVEAPLYRPTISSELAMLERVTVIVIVPELFTKEEVHIS
jgi:hypothetical protein